MIIKAKLLALKEDQKYIIYVFQNLDDNSYVMCTRLPNWESPVININDIGYLNYKEVIGGESEWYHKETKKNISTVLIILILLISFLMLKNVL